jgi:hypothetical protein
MDLYIMSTWTMVYGTAVVMVGLAGCGCVAVAGCGLGPLVPQSGTSGRSGNVGTPTQNRLLFYFLVESCEVRSRV